MKRLSFIIALSVALLAIILVGAYSAIIGPHIFVNQTKADIDMQLVYANFWTSNMDSNPNTSTSLTSYITVIKITNHASQTAYITDVTVDAAQNVTVYPSSANMTNNSPSINVSHDSSHVFSGISILVESVFDDKRDGLRICQCQHYAPFFQQSILIDRTKSSSIHNQVWGDLCETIGHSFQASSNHCVNDGCIFDFSAMGFGKRRKSPRNISPTSREYQVLDLPKRHKHEWIYNRIHISRILAICI